MGLINNDSISLHNGISISGTYYSLFRTTIGLSKIEYGSFTFQVDFGVWKDKSTRENIVTHEYSTLKHHTIIIQNMTETDLSKNLTSFAYEKLKLEITNHTDDI